MEIQLEEYGEITNEDSLSYKETGEFYIELFDVQNGSLGYFEVWFDSDWFAESGEKREYICCNDTIYYLDSMSII